MAEDGKVVFKYVGDTSGIDQANQEAEGKVKGLGSKLGSIGIKAAAAIGAAAVAAGTAIAKIGADFESAFAGVIKTVDATDEQLAKLREGILDMSTVLPASAAEIAGVAEAAGQLGIETDNILGFTRAMIDLGEATNLTAEEAATQLARFANIMQMPQTEFDKLGSTIVALGNNFATTEAEIVAMGMRLAGAGKQANMSESDIMGIAAALSSVGIEAEAGGSAFSKVITDINIAVQTGNEDLEKFADVAGMSAQQFAQAFQTDAAGAVASFVAGLGRMEEKGGSAILTLEDLGIREIRMRDALLRASGAGDLLTESLGMANQAWEENTALTTEAEQRYATLESRWAMLKNQVSAIAISLYDQMRPALSGVLDGMSGMFKAMEESGALEEFGKSLGDIASVIGDALIGILPILVDLINKLLPPIMDLVRALLPPLLALVDAIMPIIDSAVVLITMLLDLLSPLIGQLEGPLAIALGLIADALSIVVGLIGLIIEGIKWLLGKGGDFKTYLNMIKSPFTSDGATAQAGITAGVSNHAVTGTRIDASGRKIVSVSSVPKNARGTSFWRGGKTLVGEEGPEIVDLPTSTRIFPADVTARMLSSMPDTGGLSSTQSIGTINVYPNSADYLRILKLLEYADSARQSSRRR